MYNENLDRAALLEKIAAAANDLYLLADGINEQHFNAVPYAASWTAPQLLRHVMKSTQRLARVMGVPGKLPERDPGEQIAQLRETFLNFSIKMESPEFIVPEPGPYEKPVVLEQFQQAFQALATASETPNLEELVEGTPLGAVTKLELLHFVIYHTQRHIHQMQKIVAALPAN